MMNEKLQGNVSKELPHLIIYILSWTVQYPIQYSDFLIPTIHLCRPILFLIHAYVFLHFFNKFSISLPHELCILLLKDIDQ
jgi:hypothetical protein